MFVQQLTKTLFEFSIRLKGPTSQRMLMKEGKFVKEPIIEDHFV